MFVSADRTASSFAAHVAEQPAAWAALPFESRRTKVREKALLIPPPCEDARQRTARESNNTVTGYRSVLLMPRV